MSTPLRNRCTRWLSRDQRERLPERPRAWYTALATGGIHGVGRLIHLLPLGSRPLGIRCEGTASKKIMVSIYGARFVPVHVAAVTGECDEVRQPDRSLWSRLSQRHWLRARGWHLARTLTNLLLS